MDIFPVIHESRNAPILRTMWFLNRRVMLGFIFGWEVDNYEIGNWAIRKAIYENIYGQE